MWNRAPYFNTRPKLLEVNYERTSQHNKGLSTVSSPIVLCSTFYGALHKLKTRTPQSLPKLRCGTSDRKPKPFGPTIWHSDGDRRRQGQTKTEKDEDSLTLGASKPTAPSQLTTPQSETQNLIFLLSRDSLIPESMKVVAVSAAPGPFVEPPHLYRS